MSSPVKLVGRIDLFYLVSFVFQYRSCDNNLENCFFPISSYSRAHVRIIYEKTKGQVPLGPLEGKQNIQAKEVYSFSHSVLSPLLPPPSLLVISASRRGDEAGI